MPHLPRGGVHQENGGSMCFLLTGNAFSIGVTRKKNTICEICHQPYQAGYTAPCVPRAEGTALDIRQVFVCLLEKRTLNLWDLEFYCREGINIPSNPREVHFQRDVAATAEEEYLLEAEYDECVLLQVLLAVLMMRHAFSLVDEDDNDLYNLLSASDLPSKHSSNLLSVFLLRILAFLMPVYIMAWIATVLLHRSQRHGSGFIGIA
ncbi:RING/FYVE/PHD zinc finger superfamily protein [Actinidia rufa]|uniref:RING/FYVE/PHD zinc finger superfamily protein n=1 Tax=Actinidia rufa TaxID=165716 RepID=A0A7J0H7Z1_9ERIC|nr:RING/FYVE/PHD zinc finger superfamily protein [Actinidia rufa]